MSAMTNTNWPDPKRPGVPLFPEKTLRHALKKKDSGEIIIRNWKSDGQHWDMIGYSAQWCSETYFYEGPVFTHTQISEMLAAERERCAKLVQDLYNSTPEAKILRLKTLFHAAKEIRNLGDAP